MHRTKKEDRPRIDTSKTRDQDKAEEFAFTLEESLPGPSVASALERWEHFRDAMYNAFFGKKTRKSADWFEAPSDEMVPFIEEKRNALAAYKSCPSECNLQVFRAARNKVSTNLARPWAPLSPAKPLRRDGIPAELLKYCKGSLITELHGILCLCWREGEVPQDMRDANIVILYKNKGDRSNCNNYRGISLLRLQVLAERVYPEFQ